MSVLARPPRAAVALSTAMAVVSALTAAVVIAWPGLFHDPAVTVGNARGTAVVALTVGVPMLLIGMVGAQQRRWRGWIAWLAALGYLTYQAVLFTFIAGFNSLFLPFVAMLGLGVWSLVATAGAIEVDRVAARFGARAPVRSIAAYLLACAALFGLAWLADILPATIANQRPASYEGMRFTTNPVHVLDLAFTLPLTAVAAVWLLARRPWGFVLAAVMVVGLTVETISVAVDQTFGRLHDPAAPLGAIPLMIALSVVGAAASALILRGGDPAGARRARLPISAAAASSRTGG